MGTRGRQFRRGFTLFELVIAVLIIGIISSVVVPVMVSASNAPGLKTAANMLAADIEYCQSACINTPGALRVVKFDLSNNRYWVALAATPDTPLTHPGDGQAYLNDFTTGRTRLLAGVKISGAVINNSAVLAFDAYGKPQTNGTDAVITLSANGSTMTITVDNTTGELTIGS